MSMDKFEAIIVLFGVFVVGMLAGMVTIGMKTEADLAELDKWRAASAYQQMQEPPKLPKWCEIIEKGNYGYNWPTK